MKTIISIIKIHSAKLLLSAACLLILASSSFKPSMMVYDQLKIITHSSTSPKKIQINEFKEIMYGKKAKWIGGKVRIAFMSTDHPVGELTAKSIYERTGKEMKKLWLGISFGGIIEGAEFFESEKEVIEYVRKTPGSIGVISSSNTTPNVSKLVVTN